MQDLTPRQIVEELDRYIIGQTAAKRAVAIALRNRHRRRQLPVELQEDIIPKNILMIGPTGVGKTEIARRLARLAGAPFVKLEATKFTEVGYVGRNVESMIRDLADVAHQMVQEERTEEVRERAAEAAEERLLDVLAPSSADTKTSQQALFGGLFGGAAAPPAEDDERARKRREQGARVRERLGEQLRSGLLEERTVEVELEEQSPSGFGTLMGPPGMEDLPFDLTSMFGGGLKGRTQKRKMTVAEAREALTGEEARKLVDQDAVKRDACERAEQTGIIFIDEIDKIAASGSTHGPDISRGGVQRDILPIIEGSTVATRHGPVRTQHILFIAAGAFHVSKPSDLIPELQGRLPIRVELENLTEDDFRRILAEPTNSLTRQYTSLLGTEGVQVRFTDEGIAEVARYAAEVNERTENIGARRLHTIMEKLLENQLFDSPESPQREIVVDAPFVREQLHEIASDADTARYIL